MNAKPEFHHLHLGGEKSFDTHEDLLSAMNKMSELDRPDIYDNQVFDIENTGVPEILFESSETETNGFRITIGDSDDVLSISAASDLEHLEQMYSLFSSITELIGMVELTTIHGRLDLNEDFIDLDIREKIDLEYNIKGIRLEHANVDHIIQQTEDGAVNMFRPQRELETFDDMSVKDLEEILEEAQEFSSKL